MATRLPRIVVSLTSNFDAWIVGSAADPNRAEPPRDYDVIVPHYRWNEAAHLIPRDAKVNTFGGWKVICDGFECDVWPGDIGWIMQRPMFRYAWHPNSGTRVQKILDTL